MKTLHGDLLQLALDGRFDVIVHGCNCWCTMGAGIAAQIKARFPEAYAADLRTTKGDRDKLGSISSALIVRDTTRFHVVNAYTQFNWRGAGVKADYPAMGQAMRAVRQAFSGRRIAYPMIGAGLAGGDWAVIAPLIDEALAVEDHTLVIYQP